MNFRFLFLFVLVALPLMMQAQLTGYAAVAYDEETPNSADERIHLHVDLLALYSGCNQSQMHTLEKQLCTGEKVKYFIEDNMQYPAAAKAAGISGKVVLRAIIEKDGTVSGARVMESDAEELEAEAVRLVTSMPKWTPGKLKEQTVRSFRKITVNFELPK